MPLLCDAGDDEEENLDEILESQDGLRGGEGDVPGVPFNPGRVGVGFGGVAAASAGFWACPFCAGADVLSTGIGGRD